MDDLGAVHVVLLASAGLVLAPAVQGRVAAQAQGVEGPAVVVIHQLSDLLQTHAPTRLRVPVKYSSTTTRSMPTASKIWADW